MENKETLHHYSCSAPICLEQTPEERSKMIWYADENICGLSNKEELTFIKQQRKIVKANKKKEVKGYFTMAMLEYRCIIKKGIKGIDPDRSDRNIELSEKKWIKGHPKIKEMSVEKKKMLADRFKKNILGMKIHS